MEKLKFFWGEFIVLARTKKLSVGIDVVFPDKETDDENTYLKKGIAIFYIIKGRGFCGNKSVKKGDLIKVKQGGKINFKNNSQKKLRVIAIYLPPYKETNIGHRK